MERKTAIEVNELKYSYLSSKRIDSAEASLKEVIKGVSFKVIEAEKVSIIGPNGAGKSTLLLNLAGLLDMKYRKGSIKILGTELIEKKIYEFREKIGFVFQDPNDQLFSTSVFDDVAFGLVNLLNKKKDLNAENKDFISDIVRKTLEQVNLAGKENDIPHFLSFGEKKLAALATVLSYDPDIFILDEPSSNLDPKNRRSFISLLKNMKQTIVVATHDLDLAYDFSDRVILLNQGSIAYDGDAKEVLRDRSFLEKNDMTLPLSLTNNKGL